VIAIAPASASGTIATSVVSTNKLAVTKPAIIKKILQLAVLSLKLNHLAAARAGGLDVDQHVWRLAVQ
jgi:hypothetical protein